jgi:hypothetical protein
MFSRQTSIGVTAPDGVPAPTQPAADNPAAPQAQPAAAAESRGLLYWGMYSLAVCTPLAIFLVVELYLFRRRKQTLKRQINKRPLLTTDVPVMVRVPKLFESQQFYKTVRLMRGRQLRPTQEMDVKLTVIETVKAGGCPILRFKQGSKLPEYLILIARASFHDHQAAFFDELAKALAAQELLVERYFYDEDPRVCYDEKGEKSVHLYELQTYFPKHRLLIFRDGDELINPITGHLMHWLVMLQYWQERILMTPRDPSEWGAKEETLSDKFRVIPATVSGMAMLVNYFESGRLEMNGGRARSLSMSVGALEPSETVEGLRRYLEEDTFQWLCACAVYPELQWDLTLYLGLLPVMDKDTMSEENLLRLIRLKWFRTGYIPDNLRELLIQELDPRKRVAIRRAIIKLLENNPVQHALATDNKSQKNLAADAYKLTLTMQRWLYNFEPADVRDKEYKIPVTFEPPEAKASSNRVLSLNFPRVRRTRFQKAGVVYLNRDVGLRFLLALSLSIFLTYAATSLAPSALIWFAGDNDRQEGRVSLAQELNRLNGLEQVTPSLKMTALHFLIQGAPEISSFSITPNTEVIQLRLIFPGNRYQQYRATLLNDEGVELFTVSGLPARTDPAGSTVILNMPARLIVPNDYELKLKGITDGGLDTVDIASYSFRVVGESESPTATRSPR